MEFVYIALGSNLGDREFAIREAIRRLNDLECSEFLRCSPVYETEPMGLPEGAEDFLNAVVELYTCLSPEPLLDALQAIEQQLGRERPPSLRYESRTIDLDLLLYGDQVIESERLKVPHPHMHERRFVVQPLFDLIPQTQIPGKNFTVSHLMEIWGDRGVPCRYYCDPPVIACKSRFAK